MATLGPLSEIVKPKSPRHNPPRALVIITRKCRVTDETGKSASRIAGLRRKSGFLR